MIIYLSGPMTGYPDLNFPAFAIAAERLRELGYYVISPHEIVQTELTWESCMRSDIKQLMDADTVAVLPGWKLSKGACIEVGLAENLGMKIISAIDLKCIKTELEAL